MSLVYFNKDHEISDVNDFEYAICYTGVDYYKCKIKKKNLNKPDEIDICTIDKSEIYKINLIKKIDIVPKYKYNTGTKEFVEEHLDKTLSACYFPILYCCQLLLPIFMDNCVDVALLLRDVLYIMGYTNIKLIHCFPTHSKIDSHLFLMVNDEIGLEYFKDIKYKNIEDVISIGLLHYCITWIIYTDKINNIDGLYKYKNTCINKPSTKIKRLYFKFLKHSNINLHDHIIKKIKLIDKNYFL